MRPVLCWGCPTLLFYCFLWSPSLLLWKRWCFFVSWQSTSRLEGEDPISWIPIPIQLLMAMLGAKTAHWFTSHIIESGVREVVSDVTIASPLHLEQWSFEGCLSFKIKSNNWLSSLTHSLWCGRQKWSHTLWITKCLPLLQWCVCSEILKHFISSRIHPDATLEEWKYRQFYRVYTWTNPESKKVGIGSSHISRRQHRTNYVPPNLRGTDMHMAY